MKRIFTFLVAVCAGIGLSVGGLALDWPFDDPWQGYGDPPGYTDPFANNTDPYPYGYEGYDGYTEYDYGYDDGYNDGWYEAADYIAQLEDELRMREDEMARQERDDNLALVMLLTIIPGLFVLLPALTVLVIALMRRGSDRRRAQGPRTRPVPAPAEMYAGNVMARPSLPIPMPVAVPEEISTVEESVVEKIAPPVEMVEEPPIVQEDSTIEASVVETVAETAEPETPTEVRTAWLRFWGTVACPVLAVVAVIAAVLNLALPGIDRLLDAPFAALFGFLFLIAPAALLIPAAVLFRQLRPGAFWLNRVLLVLLPFWFAGGSTFAFTTPRTGWFALFFLPVFIATILQIVYFERRRYLFDARRMAPPIVNGRPKTDSGARIAIVVMVLGLVLLAGIFLVSLFVADLLSSPFAMTSIVTQL